MVQHPGMALVDRPCFTAIEQCDENYGPVHLDLGRLGDVLSIPDVPVESAQGNTSFCKSGIHFVVNNNASGDSAAKVGDLFHRIQSLSIDDDVWFNAGFAWSQLMQHFRLLCTYCQAEVVAGPRFAAWRLPRQH